ncbi:MAG TPA: pyridoxal phosphate-dependent aminotransferase [bacterium]|nr:pyridoxal phosphate-dependent aminotransferase [bacterium]
MKQLAQRMNAIQPSPTLVIDARAKELKAQGKNVINFGVGEPDFETPAHIREAAKRAIDEGKTRYTPVAGTVSLKKTVMEKLRRENNLHYTTDEIIITNGGKHALFQIFMALVDEGDEVIVPSPYWVSYPDQIRVFGGRPVIIPTTDKTNFKITSAELEANITNKTIAFVLNSPSNPTGAAYHPDELRALAAVCQNKGVYIISDEIYEHIVFDDFSVTSIASLSPQSKQMTIIANGASKCYAMTGWRMGFAAGPAHIISAMSKAQGQSTSNVCSITQAACEEAYGGPQQAIKEMVCAFQERRDHIVAALNRLPGVTCKQPKGAFYVFPNISGLMGRQTSRGPKLNTSQEFCMHLLEEYGVATVPGSAFGCENYFRISYATSLEEIKEGMNRISQLVQDLTKGHF